MSKPGPQVKLSRRQFHGGMIAAAAAGLAAVWDVQAEGKFPKGRYVDVHTHLGQTWNSTKPLTPEQLLRWMDTNSISQAVVLPLVSPESSSYPLTPDFVLRQTRPHRDRLIPFCSVDPRTSYKGGHKGLVGMLRKYQQAGAKGFGEHKPGVPIDDRRNMAIYAACQEVGFSVLFHLDTIRNTDKPGLPGLEKAVKEHPKCQFIGHGPGWWASISGDCQRLGGYPRGKVTKGGAIDRLMENYPNIHDDLSAGSGANSISRDLKFGLDFLVRRADRLMFGTDYLAPGQNVPQLQLFGKLELPTKVQAKVFRDNARKLLQLGEG